MLDSTVSSNTRHYKLISWAGDVAQLVKTCPEWSSNSTYIHRTPVIPVLENGDRRTRSSRSSLATKHTWDQSGIQETCLKTIKHTHTHSGRLHPRVSPNQGVQIPPSNHRQGTAYLTRSGDRIIPSTMLSRICCRSFSWILNGNIASPGGGSLSGQYCVTMFFR